MNIGSDVVRVHMQCTVFVMALIGMAVYSTTYALMYAATAVATVPVLEMWMVTTHLTCAALSVLFSRHHVKITHSIFLGVACGITILSNDCIQYGNCELYFGAAAVPRIAAAGAIAWAWVMYGVSFDGIPDTFIAALAMAMVPLAIEAKTVAACGDKWRHQLGANDLMWVRVAVSIALLIASLFAKRWIFALQPVITMLIQPRAAKTVASPLPYYITVLALVFLSYFKLPRNNYQSSVKSLPGRA
jgi:hypothetical protein